MKASIPPVKGTRDFYPEEMAARTWLYRKLAQISSSFGYQEYEAPMIERLELYAAKSGEELVKEQAFVFNDRGGDLITLRPELTLSLARMVVQKQRELVYPLRWWSYGPFWRYERPQKGRTREFFQWNIDLIGADSPESDAELIAIAAQLFRSVGLTPDQVVIMVNNRRLMDQQLTQLKVNSDLRGLVFRLIDRRDKMRPEEWVQYAMQGGLTEAQIDGIKTLLADKDLWKQSPELQSLFTALEAFGVRDYVQYNPEIIRGLDYYTGTVFEARDKDREGRAILGGGHYDNLVADVGGDPLSGVGFAMGDVMITLVLQKYGLLPNFPATTAQVLVTVFDQDRLPISLQTGAALREVGLNTVSFTEPIKLQKQLKYADRIGVRFVVIIGPDEEASGQAALKDLLLRQQQIVALQDLPATIRSLLAQGV